jgi:class 3 adenylate cyclase/pimeloyl-ACP methyl ester carboxylesterase
VAEPPDVRYAKSGELSIAYEVLGSGAIDLVHVPGLLNTIEGRSVSPTLARFYEYVQRFARVISLDKRGSGLSDRLAPGEIPSLEDRLEDVREVMDAAGVERAALLGVADGGPTALVFAVTYPERTRALVLSNTAARIAWAPDYPSGTTEQYMAEQLEIIEREWGTGVTPHTFLAEDRERPTFARLERLAGTPRAAVSMIRAMYATDVRDLLPAVRVPTLVIHDPTNPIWPLAGAEYLAARIPSARLVLVRDTLLPGETGPAETGPVIEEFLTGMRPSDEAADRVLKTVLFTDIVGATERAAALGDGRWRALLDAHDAAVRDELARSRGQEIKTTGDGFLAAFDGPARAVRCARAIVARAAALGLDVRAGVHAGECELRGDDLAGIAVHTGARVAAMAGAREVLVTSTVRDLVAGSGLTFVDRGRHPLRGVPGEWTLLALA